MKKCECCNKEHNNPRFCSHKCFSDCRELVEYTEERKKKISKATKSWHDRMTKDERDDINKKLKIKNTKKVSKEEVSEIRRIVNDTLMVSAGLIAKEVGLSLRVYYRITQQFGIDKEIENKLRYIPEYIQRFKKERVEELFKDMREIPYDKVIKKYKISKKTLERFYKHYKIEKIYKTPDFKETVPERIVREFLESESFDFIQEKHISQSTRCDFLIGEDLVIEVYGDYWHTNPNIYDREDKKSLTSVQKKNLINDDRKEKYYKEEGYELVIVWESDLKLHKLATLKNLKNRIDEFRKSNNG